MLLIIKNKNVKCSFISGDELDCAFCKFRNTNKCKLKGSIN